MTKVRILEIKSGIYERNNQVAAELREQLAQRGVCLINILSSPGSGKTTLLLSTLAALKSELRIAVLEADIDSDVDAQAIAALGVDALQLHTSGACHTDAEMVRQCLEALDTQARDLVFVENIGNLICTAGYDLGQNKNVVLTSVPEGDDKPLKYPDIYKVADLVVVTKTDVMPYFDFDLEAFKTYVARLNPDVQVLPVSAKTLEGMSAWLDWLRAAVKAVQR